MVVSSAPTTNEIQIVISRGCEFGSNHQRNSLQYFVCGSASLREISFWFITGLKMLSPYISLILLLFSLPLLHSYSSTLLLSFPLSLLLSYSPTLLHYLWRAPSNHVIYSQNAVTEYIPGNLIFAPVEQTKLSHSELRVNHTAIHQDLQRGEIRLPKEAAFFI